MIRGATHMKVGTNVDKERWKEGTLRGPAVYVGNGCVCKHTESMTQPKWKQEKYPHGSPWGDHRENLRCIRVLVLEKPHKQKHGKEQKRSTSIGTG